jgi:hypothetical protein
MKRKFPGVDFARIKKQLKRYTPNKAGVERLGEDVGNGLDQLSDLVDRKTEHLDPIYSEPVYKKPAEETGEDLVLTRGPIDYTFLFIVIGLCLFGALMAFSASSVYAAQYHDDSAYYIKRHILYLVIASGVTAFFVWWARPWFWRFCGVASYGGSVLLLLLVLIIGSSYGSGATR